MKLNKISADMVSRRPDQTAEWLNRLARQVDIVEASAASSSKKPGDLPIATTYSLGVVKIGQNLSITPEGVLSALAPTSYDYELLFNKPKINNVELIGNKSLSDLGIDIPTKTSELLNDGSDSTSVYVELDELATVATSGSYADLLNKPSNLSDFNNDVGYITSADLPTKTSELQNDGADGTSTYVEHDELATVATSGSYTDLINKPTIGNATLTIQKNSTNVGTFTANAASNKTIDISVPTQTSDIVNNGADGTSTYVEADELATVATSGSYADLLNKPTIGNATLTIQKNGASAGTFTANATSNKTINITVPTTAADVGALPDSTKYAASLSLTINSSTFVITGQLKDQDGNNLGTAQTIDLPLESVVVSGSYDSATKEVVLVLENGSEIRFSVADLVSGLQTEITSANPLDADLVDDSTSTNKFVTSSDITTWNGKQDALTAGSNIQINGTTISATDTTYSAGSGISLNGTTFSVDTTTIQPKLTAGSNIQINGSTISATDTTYTAGTGLNLNGTQFSVDTTTIATKTDLPTKTSDLVNDGSDNTSVYVEADELATVATSGSYSDLSNKPTIGNATLTIQKNGTNVQTFTANATSNKTANITVPTKTSDITNDGADGTSTYVENDDLTTALAGKQDTLTAGTNININSNTISTQTRGIEYIVGTQASATNLWTGVSTDNGCSNGTVYIGKTIAYYLPVAGNNSAATLNLTLPDGTTTGEIPLRRTVSGTITTHFSAGNVIIFTYDGTYWKMSAYYDSNDNYNTRLYNTSIKATAAITSGRICIGTSSGYKMVASGVESDITYPILYAGSNVNAGSTNDNFYTIIRSVNLQNTKSGWTGVATQEVWLVGTLSGSTFTVDSNVFTQTTPTTEDGKTYTPIGITYNTNAIFFCPSNVYWQYKNGAFRPISHSEPVMTGADSGTAGTAGLVPAPAAGDNTKYLSGDGTWKTVSQYALPIATANDLGGIKVGSRLTINSTTGVLSADSQTDNNFTTTLKNKLDGIAAGAEVNVQANWTEANSSSDAYIKNKPSLATVATSGSYNDLTNKPTIPAAQVNSDWDANSGVAQILNKPSLATVATSGSYNDLTNKPTIPTVNNGTLTIQKNGTNVQTFTANQSTNATANITVPTKTSELTNDSNFVPSTSLATVATSGSYNDLSNKPTIPTVNNATLTIQKNGTTVKTFTANASSNVTANITVPTKTSDLTNDSGFVTDATSQNFAAQEGSTNPVFDDMTPVRTIEWDVSDTKYRPIYQMANTNWTYINMDITVAYRITVTGTGIHSVTDIVDRWHNPVSYPITSMFCRTLSNSGATTGFRYLRAVYPVAAYLNNATYPLGQEVAQYNNTARHYKIEVFKDDAQVSWNSVKPSGPIYVSSTYNGNSSMTAYDTRGWRFRQPSQMYAQNAGYADYIANYEPVNVAAGELKNGATALVAGHFAFLAEDGLVYDISNTAKAISVPEAKIGWLNGNVNANAAISYTNWRAISRPTAAQTEFFSHDAFALGDRLYLRCTMDANGKIYSGNYLATNMSAGYTWMPIGWARNATQFYADTRFPTFYTLNSSGKLTHVNGKKTSPDITVTNTDPGEGVALGEGEYVAVYGSSSSLIDMFYPIGSYYETSNTAFDPNVSWGGTWVEDTGGRVLVAQDSGTFTTVGGTGGEETHQLVAAEIPSHHHSIFVNDTAGGGQYASPDGGNYAGKGRNYNTNDTGGGGAHNNLQPYIIIKRWHRTA